VPDDGVRLVAVEPLSCPTLTQGRFEYDFGDSVGMAPLLPMYTLGHDYVPPSIHAGGLRYHGDSPTISALVRDGRMEAVAYPQGKVRRCRAVREGRGQDPGAGVRARDPGGDRRGAGGQEKGEERVILFNYCGHGLLDLSAYDDYLNGRLPDEQG